MPKSQFTLILIVLGCLVLFAHPAHAFGAGNVDAGAALADKILGAVFQHYGKEVLQKIYFGNWLRDYSQAMDVTLMNKLGGDVDSILTIVMLLAFKEFPSGAGAFKVTSDKLRVYLPVEHIDNPKGYPGKAGLEGNVDEWAYNNLRSACTQAELEIDTSNGMKKYIATKGNGWQTSWKHVYDRLMESVAIMRNYPNQEQVAEALRLLGDAMHTLEDFTAHSNWIELSLIKMGHTNVFPMVGDGVRYRSPDGQSVPPLVTGSFGALDLMHSLTGEGSDKASQGNIGGFAFSLDGSNAPDLSLLRNAVKGLLSLSDDAEKKDRLNKDLEMLDEHANFQPNGKDAGDLNKTLWAGIIEATGLPFLKAAVDQVRKALESVVMGIISQRLAAIKQASDEIAKKQYEQPNVFDDANCSDLSHSQLAKDHFVHCLNEPAGLVAKEIVRYSAEVIKSLYDDHGKDADSYIKNEILPCLFHPMFVSGSPAGIQAGMTRTLQQYLDGMDRDMRDRMVQSLDKDGVRNHRHYRELPASASASTLGLGTAVNVLGLPISVPAVINVAKNLDEGRNMVNESLNSAAKALNEGNNMVNESLNSAAKTIAGWFS